MLGWKSMTTFYNIITTTGFDASLAFIRSVHKIPRAHIASPVFSSRLRVILSQKSTHRSTSTILHSTSCAMSRKTLLHVLILLLSHRLMSVYQRSFNPADRTRQVHSVTVTASGSVNTSTGSSGENYFHWRIYLTLLPANPPPGSGSQSVLLDMIPTNPPVATLCISSKENAGSTARQKIELELQPLDGLTVGHVIDLFIDNNMHRYKFDSTGSGCLFWTMTAVDLLQQHKYIESQAVDKLNHFHTTQAALHPERHPLPLRQGTFY